MPSSLRAVSGADRCSCRPVQRMVADDERPAGGRRRLHLPFARRVGLDLPAAEWPAGLVPQAGDPRRARTSPTRRCRCCPDGTSTASGYCCPRPDHGVRSGADDRGNAVRRRDRAGVSRRRRAAGRMPSRATSARPGPDTEGRFELTGAAAVEWLSHPRRAGARGRPGLRPGVPGRASAIGPIGWRWPTARPKRSNCGCGRKHGVSPDRRNGIYALPLARRRGGRAPGVSPARPRPRCRHLLAAWAAASARRRARTRPGDEAPTRHGGPARLRRGRGHRGANPPGAGAGLGARGAGHADDHHRRAGPLRVQGAGRRPLHRHGVQGRIRHAAVRPAPAGRTRHAGRSAGRPDAREAGHRPAARQRHRRPHRRRVR